MRIIMSLANCLSRVIFMLIRLSLNRWSLSNPKSWDSRGLIYPSRIVRGMVMMTMMTFVIRLMIVILSLAILIIPAKLIRTLWYCPIGNLQVLLHQECIRATRILMKCPKAYPSSSIKQGVQLIGHVLLSPHNCSTSKAHKTSWSHSYKNHSQSKRTLSSYHT